MLLFLVTVRNSSCGKVIFSQACVKNSVHGGCIPACTGQGDVYPSMHWAGVGGVSQHALGRGMYIPACTGQGWGSVADTPLGRHPPGRHTPPPTTAVDGMHSTGMHSCFFFYSFVHYNDLYKYLKKPFLFNIS